MEKNGRESSSKELAPCGDYCCNCGNRSSDDGGSGRVKPTSRACVYVRISTLNCYKPAAYICANSIRSEMKLDRCLN